MNISGHVVSSAYQLLNLSSQNNDALRRLSPPRRRLTWPVRNRSLATFVLVSKLAQLTSALPKTLLGLDWPFA